MTISQHNGRTNGNFTATENGAEAGKLLYSWAGIDKLIVEHTEVKPQFAHQGVGQDLVMAVVKYAREQNIKVIPLCPFTKSVFKKHKEIGDVLF